MKSIREQIKIQRLLEIKKIVDKDKAGELFVIVRTNKNIDFMREYGLNNEDVKNIVRRLAVEDCFAGPEADRSEKHSGMVFIFDPMFDNIKLYVKIRYESQEMAVCISVHEFGKYD